MTFDPKDNLGKCWHEGREIVQSDDGLLIHEVKARGESGSQGDEPNYSLTDSYETGLLGANPWREK